MTTTSYGEKPALAPTQTPAADAARATRSADHKESIEIAVGDPVGREEHKIGAAVYETLLGWRLSLNDAASQRVKVGDDPERRAKVANA